MASAVAQDHHDARALPVRRGGHQADLVGAVRPDGGRKPQRARMDQGDEPVCIDVPRPIHPADGITCGAKMQGALPPATPNDDV